MLPLVRVINDVVDVEFRKIVSKVDHWESVIRSLCVATCVTLRFYSVSELLTLEGKDLW